MHTMRNITLILVMAMVLFGCSSASQPKLIAEYPSGDSPPSIGSPPLPLPEFRLVYYAYLMLEVSNLDRSAFKAEAMAYDLGGYLVRSDTWEREGHRQVTQVFAVPMPNFEEFRNSILDLGKLKTERVWGEWVRYSPGNLPNYAEVTVQLQTKGIEWPSLPIRGWNPVRTLGRALEVFIAIFGFLADTLIWVGVVLGPFVLLAWLGWKLALRLRRKP